MPETRQPVVLDVVLPMRAVRVHEDTNLAVRPELSLKRATKHAGSVALVPCDDKKNGREDDENGQRDRQTPDRGKLPRANSTRRHP